MAAVTEEEDTPSAETVATVKILENKIEQAHPVVNIVEISGKNCKLSALIDTGSPVLFVK